MDPRYCSVDDTRPIPRNSASVSIFTSRSRVINEPGVRSSRTPPHSSHLRSHPWPSTPLNTTKRPPNTTSTPPAIIAKLRLTTNPETTRLQPTTPTLRTLTRFTPLTMPPKLPRLTPTLTVANPKLLPSNAGHVNVTPPSEGSLAVSPYLQTALF